MAKELHKLWDLYPLYKFINGAQWVRKRELEICECLMEDDREQWIEVCRSIWDMQQLEEEKKIKKDPH